MPPLDEAVDFEDNWTGVTDPKERRKRQNRLHQRAWRRRQAAQRDPKPGVNGVPGTNIIRIEKGSGTIRDHSPSSQDSTSKIGASLPRDGSLSLPKQAPGDRWRDALVIWQYRSHLARTPLRLGAQEPFPGPHPSPSIEKLHSLIRSLDYGAPLSAILAEQVFPLSADHKLITLVQYNVIRGLFTNIMLLGLQDEIISECDYNLNIAPMPYLPAVAPCNFEWTTVQKTIKHPSWIDTTPSPEMRDNLILNLDLVDQDALCDDLVGGIYDGFNDIEVRGLILWGDPWDIDGWEVTEGFAKRWGPLLLKGCKGVLDATNRWRESRGEEELVF
ncbi:hypothetical protein GQ53DRAFT_753258 [Thozetella sp. PMI_491]|nr:hypothetical protein GQ53DRAFT_753258 [Thozetella sp. PMI_491]